MAGPKGSLRAGSQACGYGAVQEPLETQLDGGWAAVLDAQTGLEQAKVANKKHQILAPKIDAIQIWGEEVTRRSYGTTKALLGHAIPERNQEEAGAPVRAAGIGLQGSQISRRKARFHTCCSEPMACDHDQVEAQQNLGEPPIKDVRAVFRRCGPGPCLPCGGRAVTLTACGSSTQCRTRWFW